MIKQKSVLLTSDLIKVSNLFDLLESVRDECKDIPHEKFMIAPLNFGEPYEYFRGNFKGMPFVLIKENGIYDAKESLKIVVFYDDGDE